MGTIKYYPSTRIRTNLYTRGNEFKLSNGSFYSGRYYVTYDGKAYVGVNPTLGTNEPLIPAQQDNKAINFAAKRNSPSTTQIPQPNTIPSTTELGSLNPYYPVPLDSDYARGYFTRYFAKQLTGQNFILEISENDWANINNGLTQQDFVAYEVTSILWQLTGPLKDTRVSQYQVKGGVFDTNKRVTEAKNKTFVGLVDYIGGDYTKFTRVTP
jgi:hypothetical protein